MWTTRTIQIDARLLSWLQSTVRRIQRGSIILEIEQGKLRAISCHGHRFISSLDEWRDGQHTPPRSLI